MNKLTLGSLFDGSGTAPLAATMLGISPLWASEIEPYPVAVTKARFPDMVHYGDITEINGAEIPPVDIIVGGSPCQDLSIAGKQAGLENGTRSNLFYEMTRIVREMRGATNGTHPRFVVWENVPGAFSSNKGRDFHEVVKAFCALADIGVHIPRPAENGRTGRLAWKTAGAIVGDGWSFAWRVIDAKHWGVPQRRRRIYAILDLGSERAGEILFERTRLPWDSEPRGETRESAAADAMGRTDGGGRVIGAFCAGAAPAAGNIGYSEQVAPTLKAGQCAFPMGAVVYPVGAVGSLCARADSSPCIDRGQPFVAYESGQGYWMPGFGCLRAEGENRPSRPSHCVISLQGNGIDRSLTAGCNGAGWREGEMYTLNTIDRPAVVYSIDQQGGKGAANYDENVMCTILSSGHGTPHAVAYGIDCRNGALNEDAAPTMQAKANGGQSLNCMPPVLYDARGNGDGKHASVTGNHDNRITDYTNVICMESAQANAAITEGISPCLNASHEQPVLFMQNRPPRRYIVRRLTPTECARLQGFPDWWVDGIAIPNPTEKDIAFWTEVWETHRKVMNPEGKPKTRKQIIKWLSGPGSDSNEYKMWGNGMALPCMLAVLNGIAKLMEEQVE